MRMHPDDIRYAALESRDRRFEGRFFVAVRTTGVYCRPGCPAPLPKRKNVCFYACAAAAEEAGFRPCMRCRPETSPGTPAFSRAGLIASMSARPERVCKFCGSGKSDTRRVLDFTELTVGSQE